MRKPRVHVVRGSTTVENMFKDMGYDVSSSPLFCDLMCFTGGADVHPSLYGQEVAKQSYPSFDRDIDEAGYYAVANRKKIPMVGICRGGQLMNVLRGGSMIQHIEGHHGPHTIYDKDTDRHVSVTSVHHQAMVPADHAYIVAESEEDHINEVIFYEEDEDNSKALCFQGHPEFAGRGDECRTYFFQLIKNFLGLEGVKA